ncbi:WD40 repeat-like protein, partial [Rhizoctonia solani]
MSSSKDDSDSKRKRARDWLREALRPSSPRTPTSVSTSSVIVKAKKETDKRLRDALTALSNASGLLRPIGAVASILLNCVDAIKAAAKNQQDYEDLATDLAQLSESLVNHLGNNTSSAAFGSVVGIVKQIAYEATKMKNKSEHDIPTERLLTEELHEDELMRHCRRIQALFRQLQIDLSAGTWSVAHKTLNTRLEQLNPVQLARYGSSLSTSINRRTCTQGTRTQVLANLTEWADNPDAPSVFWMNGMAGTGKTTIACTFSEQLKRKGLLAASFFCTQSSAECQDATRIVPTIANRLARYSPSFQQSLCEAISQEPNAKSKTIDRQFELLLAGPLKKAGGDKLTNQVVVIDALDECNDPKGVVTILEMLFRHAPQLPIKFFVTSRPEPGIYETMKARPESQAGMILHEIDQSLVSADIELYLKEELAFVSPCVSDADIKQLVERSGALFIYAATLVRYIRPVKHHDDPNKRLQSVLSMTSGLELGHVKQPMDMLYRAVLKSAHDEDLDDSEREDVRMVLRTVLFAQEPISVETIAILADIDNTDRVEYALSLLRSVVFYSESTHLVSILHTSFSDFIFEKTRSEEYFCDTMEHSPALANRCFQVMEKQLRMNICNLPSSFLPDEKVEDLQDRIKRSISPTLSYACRYWINHLQRVIKVEDIAATFDEFLSRRLLFWLEVISLQRDLPTGVLALLAAKQWLTSTGTASQSALAILIEDAANFVMDYASIPAPRSTPHIYISSLPLCPRSSTVYKNYRSRMQGLLELKGSVIDRRETAPVATWNTNSVTSLAYSSDGSRVAVGCKDTVNIRSGYDGAVLAGPLQGHTSSVNSIAFSPDGGLVASGSWDGTVILWDAYNGTRIAGPLSHTGTVYSVSFSPDSVRIVSGGDGKVWVWNATNGKLLLGPLEGHDSLVKCVTFSPGGTLIASGSSDCTIRLWRSDDGTLAIPPLEFPTGGVICLEFTSDGNRIIGVCNAGTICVWNVSDGSLVTSVNIEGIKLAAVSPDGAFVAIGTYTNVQVRRIADGSLVAGFVSSLLSALAFSPDGTRLISSTHRGIHVRSVRKGLVSSPASLVQIPENIKSLSFSVDGTCVVLGSDEATQVWDISDGTCKPNSDVETQLASQPSRDSSPGGLYVADTSGGKLKRIVSTVNRSMVAGPFDPALKLWQFSRDGNSIIMCNGGLIQMQHLKGRDAPSNIISPPLGQVHFISQSLDGSILASFVEEVVLSNPALYISSLFSPLLRLISCADPVPDSAQTNSQLEATHRLDGWMSSNDNLLFWLPSNILPGVSCRLTLHTLLIVTRSGTLVVPKQELYVGNQWSRCYIGD